MIQVLSLPQLHREKIRDAHGLASMSRPTSKMSKASLVTGNKWATLTSQSNPVLALHVSTSDVGDPMTKINILTEWAMMAGAEFQLRPPYE